MVMAAVADLAPLTRGLNETSVFSGMRTALRKTDKREGRGGVYRWAAVWVVPSEDHFLGVNASTRRAPHQTERMIDSMSNIFQESQFGWVSDAHLFSYSSTVLLQKEWLPLHPAFSNGGIEVLQLFCSFPSFFFFSSCIYGFHYTGSSSSSLKKCNGHLLFGGVWPWRAICLL